MDKVVFIGERRSPKARQMNVRWEDGRLAAKQLFDAFEACGFTPQRAWFFNLFERGGNDSLFSATLSRLPIVAMGRRVQTELAKRQVKFIAMVHPAARGAVRKKAVYFEEVRRALTAAGALKVAA